MSFWKEGMIEKLRHFSHLRRAGSKFLSTLFFFAFFLFIFISCAENKKEPEKYTGAASGARNYDAINISLSPNSSAATTFATTLSNFSTSNLDEEGLWAVSQNDSIDNFGRSYFAKLAITTGAMPQTLHPKIRNKVLEMPDAKTLLEYSQGVGTPSAFIAMAQSGVDFLSSIPILGGLVSGEVKAQIEKAKNLDVEKEIRKNIADLMATVLPNAERLDNKMTFRIDGFPSPLLTGNSGNSFKVSEQATLWALVWAAPYLWGSSTNGATYSDNDKNIHLFTVLQTFMDMQYLFGLQTEVEGRIAGGLTLGIESGSNLTSSIGPFDPRTTYEYGRFLSGSYTITLPYSAPIDLVLLGGETWNNQQGNVTIEEQAKVWTAAAYAFRRVRPKNLPNTLPLIGEGKLLPNEVTLLPLAFLPGLQTLLDGPFIDQTRRVIKQNATLKNAKAESAPEDTTTEAAKPQGLATPPDLATFKGHVRLMKALYVWVEELSNLDDLAGRVDDQLLNKLKGATPQVKKAIQLSVQQILAHFTKTVALANGEPVLSLMDRKGDTQFLNVATAAEALSMMVIVEAKMFKSIYLEQQIDEMYRWLFYSVFASAWNGQSTTQLSAEDIIWLHQAFKTYTQVKPNGAVARQAQEAFTALDRVILDWNSKLAN